MRALCLAAGQTFCGPRLAQRRAPPCPAAPLPRSFLVLQRKDPEAASRLAGQAQEHILLRHERLKRMAEEGEPRSRCRCSACPCHPCRARVARWGGGRSASSLGVTCGVACLSRGAGEVAFRLSSMPAPLPLPADSPHCRQEAAC